MGLDGGLRNRFGSISPFLFSKGFYNPLVQAQKN